MKILLLLLTVLSYSSTQAQTIIQQEPRTVQAGVEYDFSFSVPPRARQTTPSSNRLIRSNLPTGR
jgi:hypothetical protein